MSAGIRAYMPAASSTELSDEQRADRLPAVIPEGTDLESYDTPLSPDLCDLEADDDDGGAMLVDLIADSERRPGEHGDDGPLAPDRLVAQLSASLAGAPTARQPELPIESDGVPVPVSRPWRAEAEADPSFLFGPTGSVVAAALALGVGAAALLSWSGALEPLYSIETTKATMTASGSSQDFAERALTGATADASRNSMRDVLALADRMVASGELDAARELLAGAVADGAPEAMLALAETFDPNVLAAWGVRGSRANTDRARTLYEGALAAGLQQARRRLDALQ